MPLKMFEGILEQLNEMKELRVADKNLTLWLAAYGDPLFDELLEARLKLLRNYHYRVPIVTNAVNLALTYKILLKYSDVVGNLSVNIPAGNPMDYNRYTLNPDFIFFNIVESLNILVMSDSSFGTRIKVNVNGAYTHDENGRCQLKFNLADGDTDSQVEQLREHLCEEICISDARPLCDRAGLLSRVAIDNSAMPNRLNWNLPVGAEKASGCNGGDRLKSWLHITNTGKIIACCQDYLETTVFADLSDMRLIDIWNSPEREKVEDRMLKSMCLKCCFSF